MPTLRSKAIISITGTHCVGKSTLLAELRRHYGDGLAFLDEPARHLIGCGYAMNHEITSEGLMMYIAHFLKELRNARAATVICDRSILDLVAYTTSSHLPQLSTEANTLAMEMLRFERAFVAQYIFIPIEFPLHIDNVRPADENYRVLVEHRVRQLLLSEGLPFSLVKGPIESRVAQVKSIIKKCVPNV
jgi:predicted ATPase